jgi:lipoprotein-releasing system permease protein
MLHCCRFSVANPAHRMRRPVWLFVGLRYLRARKGSGFVSFVTVASVIGVALGVATLIVVLSVMNGFENELRQRLLGLTSHASVLSQDGMDDWPQFVEQLLRNDKIVGAAPYIEVEALLSGPAGMAGAMLTGVEPSYEVTVSRIDASMLIGRLGDLKSGGKNIVLGRALAQKLGVAVGGRVNVLVPKPPVNGKPIGSKLDSYVVSGLFELGVQDHDSARGMIQLDDAAELRGDTRISGIRVETKNIFTAPSVVREQVAKSPMAYRLSVRDWTQENASYFRAIRIEKTMMAILLSLIIGVAAFNIVATLVMVVTEKRRGIAILRTMGCSRRDVVAIFVLQGTLIGWIGAGVGIVLGIWMAVNIDELAPLVEQMLGFEFMPADLYYLTALPAELRWADVLWTSAIVLAVTATATIYPATRAASVQPAEVLRYE